METCENVVAESWSYDQGNSWTELQATELPNPSAGVDGMSLRDARNPYVFNEWSV